MAEEHPNTNPTTQAPHDSHKTPRIVAAVVAILVIAFCAWSMSEYVNGRDPLAFLTGSNLLQTTAETTPSSMSASTSGATSPASDDGASATEQAASSEDVTAAATSSSSDESSAASAVGGDASSGGVSDDASSSSDSSGTSQGSVSSVGQASSSNAIIVGVTVDGSAAGGRSGSVQVSVPMGATVYDALLAAGANVSATSTAYGTYVAGINGLAEREHGGSSGWVYAVNGAEPNVACSAYELSSGDSVVWTYVNVTD